MGLKKITVLVTMVNMVNMVNVVNVVNVVNMVNFDLFLATLVALHFTPVSKSVSQWVVVLN